MQNIKGSLLTKEGYLISKKHNIDNIDNIKDELTVEPVQTCTFAKKPEKFSVYQENDDYLCIPKYYGINKFGHPDKNKEKKGKKVELKFNSVLRDKQKEIISKIIPHLEQNDGGVLCLPCGYGKCLAYDTDVLMYNGELKKVQDIIVGDKIMGDDSWQRKILSIASGVEEMYDVICNEQNFKYTVNKSHILSLYDSVSNNFTDVTVEKYLKFYDYYRFLKGYRRIVRFEEKLTLINPYTYGYNMSLESQHINNEYKINSIRKRKLFVHGFLDKYAYSNPTNYEFATDKITKTLLNDIMFMIYSVGYNIIKNNNYIQIIILPLLENKYTLYDIEVKYAYTGNYYGFEIDGNRRFLLGDCTVTHNTILSLYIASYFSVKTLVIVHKTFLLNQWRERAEEFTNAKVGIIQQDTIDIDDKQIVIGMLQSISKDKYTPDVFKDFGLVIFDEAHHAPSKYFSQALPIINCKKAIALSATPKRSDRLEKVLYWYFGDIMYKLDNTTNASVLVNIYNYKLNHEKFKEAKLRTGDINRARTINKITTIGRRNKFIIDCMIPLLTNLKRKIIVLSDRVEHLKLLNKRLESNTKNIESSFYIGGMKMVALKKAEQAQVIFATYSMAAEALDIPELNTLFMVTPRREIEQAVGRILRKIDADNRPIIYDFIDQLPSFVGQGVQRKYFYKKMKFEQLIFNVNENEITDGFEDEEVVIENNNYDFID
jgi:superfamily II DNA or RNA helicase